jgi:hypothetical protein
VDATVGILEDQTYSFSAADFPFTDTNDASPNTLLSVRIATLPSNGVLCLLGSPVLPGQANSASNLTQLTFTPVANANGLPYTLFTFRVQDNGGTANGGVDVDSTPNTVTINVTPVNDAPSGTDNTIAILEDQRYTFVAADFGFSDPSDTPANTFANLKITTLLGSGQLKLSSTAVTVGQFIPVASISQLNYTPAANVNGSPAASFTFQVQD